MLSVETQISAASFRIWIPLHKTRKPDISRHITSSVILFIHCARHMSDQIDCLKAVRPTATDRTTDRPRHYGQAIGYFHMWESGHQ